MLDENSKPIFQSSERIPCRFSLPSTMDQGLLDSIFQYACEHYFESKCLNDLICILHIDRTKLIPPDSNLFQKIVDQISDLNPKVSDLSIKYILNYFQVIPKFEETAIQLKIIQKIVNRIPQKSACFFLKNCSPLIHQYLLENGLANKLFSLLPIFSQFPQCIINILQLFSNFSNSIEEIYFPLLIEFLFKKFQHFNYELSTTILNFLISFQSQVLIFKFCELNVLPMIYHDFPNLKKDEKSVTLSFLLIVSKIEPRFLIESKFSNFFFSKL